MKALPGSCPKVIVESSLERRVGSISVSDHQGREFCLRPLLRNDKAFNLRLLQVGLAQRKGFQPLHAVESRTQVAFFLCISDFVFLIFFIVRMMGVFGFGICCLRVLTPFYCLSVDEKMKEKDRKYGVYLFLYV